jgi:hypothetical protein
MLGSCPQNNASPERLADCTPASINESRNCVHFIPSNLNLLSLYSSQLDKFLMSDKFIHGIIKGVKAVVSAVFFADVLIHFLLRVHHHDV